MLMPKTAFEDSDAMMDWIVDQAIILYVTSEVDNDFVLLHGITSAWALKIILRQVKNPMHRLESIRVLLAIILMAYVSQGRPRLDLDKLKNDSELPSWDEIRQRSFSIKKFPGDEHIFKLIHVRK